MLFASWLDSALGWCCLGPVIVVVLFIWALSSVFQSAAEWCSSNGGGVVEEVAKEVAQEVATSWLEEWLRGWFQ